MADILTTVQGMIEATIQRVVPGLVRGQDTALGTLVDRDTSGLTGRATFDPSSNPVPVKVSGAVQVYPGDRVAMVRTGGYWTVVGALAVRGLGEDYFRGTFTATQTTNVNTYSDVTVAPDTLSFTKMYPGTDMIVKLHATAWCSVSTSTALRFGARITGVSAVDGSAYDSGDADLVQFHFNTLSEHATMCGEWRPATVPPGTHTVTLRWRRNSGAGTLNVNTDDSLSFSVDEKRRQ